MSPASRWRVSFADAEGKALPVSRGFGHLALVFGDWHPYTDVCYTPANAAAMEFAVVLPNGENGVLLDDWALGPCPDEGAINCNPDFRYGPCSYTGWASLNTGALFVKVGEGKYGLNTAYGSSSEPFPLREPGTYRLYARGAARGGFRTVDLRIYDAKGALIKILNIVGLPNGNSVDVLLPDGAAAGSLLVYHHILEEVRVMRVGDANALAELDAARAAAQKK
ncbi:MAG TPA: hypothetical protein PLZ36_04060 [Armatimonadota bacterium]|nr:hypothetical protein [Armatimonadota bacterium]